jgi:hypothetical protein
VLEECDKPNEIWLYNAVFSSKIVLIDIKQIDKKCIFVNFIFMGPCIVRYKGGIYDQQDATNSQYFIVMIALHVSGDHCPSSGARNCMCSRTVYRLCGSLFGRFICKCVCI